VTGPMADLPPVHHRRPAASERRSAMLLLEVLEQPIGARWRPSGAYRPAGLARM
jgi:hypothetical protein